MDQPLGVMTLYVIFDHPSDHPDHFVVREQSVKSGSSFICLGKIGLADTLEAARAIVPFGLYQMPRQTDDDPNIIEVWF